MQRVASVMDAVALAPLLDRLLRDAVALGNYPAWFGGRLDHRPDLRCRHRLLVQRNQDGMFHSRTARRIDLAMRKAVRRASM